MEKVNILNRDMENILIRAFIYPVFQSRNAAYHGIKEVMKRIKKAKYTNSLILEVDGQIKIS